MTDRETDGTNRGTVISVRGGVVDARFTHLPFVATLFILISVSNLLMIVPIV